MLAHVNSVPNAPSSIDPDIPEELDRIILTALEKDPSQRFGTASEFSNALAEAERAAQEKTGKKSLPRPVQVSTPRAEAPRVSYPGPAPIRVAEPVQTDRAAWIPVAAS